MYAVISQKLSVPCVVENLRIELEFRFIWEFTKKIARVC